MNKAEEIPYAICGNEVYRGRRERAEVGEDAAFAGAGHLQIATAVDA